MGKISVLELRCLFKCPKLQWGSQLYPLASTSLWTQAIPEKGLDLQHGNFLQPREISGEGWVLRTVRQSQSQRGSPATQHTKK